jgi:hypothetical protein
VHATRHSAHDLLVASLGIALALGACSEPERGSGRVILIGIDGTSPLVVRPMLAEGRLPNLAAIAERGAGGMLRSVLPLFSPRIWNTIATGRTPKDHGITAFVHKDEGGVKHLYLSHDRKVPALWNILSAQDLSVGVVNWWTTYPPEKINGAMVSDHFFPEQIEMIKRTFKDGAESSGDLLHPASLSERAFAMLEEQGLLTHVQDPFAGNSALPHWVNRDVLSRQFETDGEVTRVALEVQRQLAPDVMMVFLPGVDRISHWLWGNLEPEEKYPPPLRPEPSEREAGAAALRDYYEYTDALIGRLIEGYGPDDLVIVLSDHGFEAGVSLMLLTGEHDTPAALNGVIFARGRGIAPGQSTAGSNVFQIAPTVLAWLGLPVPRDMVGAPLGFVSLDAVSYVTSYDDLEIERVEVETAGQEDAIVEHLRSLGYLEDDAPGDAPPKPANEK